MRLFLVRHGVTRDTGRILTGRLAGVSLSDAGRHGATVAAEAFASVPLAAVYTSPIERCRETAKIIGSRRDLTPLTEHGLIEADYGSWSGRRLTDLRRLKAWERLMTHPSRFRFPQGETLHEVQVRSVATVETLADRHGDQLVVAVSHADVIRVLLCQYLGMPLDLIHRLHVDPVGVSVIDVAPSGSVTVPVVNHSPTQFDNR